ncbi:ATP synthase F0 subcomplex B subunit [Mucilaginibacter gracilis]|uniref:ATP synthase subunit b n=1 Tax=Mucilaginibacter gracilis TaxID=423350 RepID=A0A495IYM6_9SPHI|nr:F0F1 ATP synthase subunit B [Mucilaginibacter gracilis]RKR81672.1 ATP synthase F0 subcomplex B subunit [Mucilaginibacter gracilis]
MNPLVTPDLGLVVWTSVAFLILFFILAKFAWKPIMAAIDERERSIEDALLKAEAAKEEMTRLTAENDTLLKQARAERDLILREAKHLKDQIVSEAKESALREGNKMIEKARMEIDSQKAIAMAEVKGLVAELSIEIAEKVLRKQFEKADKQDELVADLLKDVKLN